MSDANAGAPFTPYVSHDQNLPEFNFKSIIAGIIFGILFGCANAYLGLRAGLTISTSIPVAVLTVAGFKILGHELCHRLHGRGWRAEN